MRARCRPVVDRDRAMRCVRHVPAGTFSHADRKRSTQCIEGSAPAVRAFQHNETFVRQPAMRQVQEGKTVEPGLSGVGPSVDVVRLDEAGVQKTRSAATAVAALQRPPQGRRGNAPLAAKDKGRATGRLDEPHKRGATGQQRYDAVGDTPISRASARRLIHAARTGDDPECAAATRAHESPPPQVTPSHVPDARTG